VETDSPRQGYLGTAWKWGTVRIEVKYTFFPIGKNGNENDELGTCACSSVLHVCVCVCVCWSVFCVL
jgi:hypothetical protein